MTMTSEMASCMVQRAERAPDLAGAWDGADWGGVDAIDVATFHSRSTDHRPRTQVKVLYNSEGLYHHFQVQDRYVLARQVGYQGPVCKDSCVEFFTAPLSAGLGYFNFEFNCGGAMLVYYKPTVEETWQHVADEWLDRITVETTMPRQVDPEITEPVTWRLACFIPLALIEAYAGPLAGQTPGPGVQWRANWYKCADRTSHPHWAAWSPIGEKLDFHQPDRFGTMRFA